MLDDLYGAGAWESYLVAAKPPGLNMQAEQAETPDGVRVYVAMTDDDGQSAGSAKVDFSPGYAYYQTLTVPNPKSGMLTYWSEGPLTDWYHRMGITDVGLTADSELSYWIFQLGGFEPTDKPRGLNAVVSGRNKEWIDWKRGLREEPAWHVELKQNPPEGAL